MSTQATLLVVLGVVAVANAGLCTKDSHCTPTEKCRTSSISGLFTVKVCVEDCGLAKAALEAELALKDKELAEKTRELMDKNCESSKDEELVLARLRIADLEKDLERRENELAAAVRRGDEEALKLARSEAERRSLITALEDCESGTQQ